MARERLVERLESAWRELIRCVDTLNEDDLLQPGATGEWSVRDLLGHISSWEREFLKALPIILAGDRLPHYSTLYGGINAFNALEQQRLKGLSLAEVRHRLAATHAELIETLAALPPQDSRVETRLRRRLRQDTHQHYRLHAEQILDAFGPAGRLTDG